MMKILCRLALLGAFWFNHSLASAQPNAPKGSLDALFDWNNPSALTPAKFKEIAEALPKKKSERAYYTQSLTGGKTSFSIGETRGGMAGGGKLNLFNGGIDLNSVSAVFDADKLYILYFQMGQSGGAKAKKPSQGEVSKLKAELDKLTGGGPKPYDHKPGGGYAPTPGLEWTHANYKVQMYEVPSFSGTKVSGTGVFMVRILPPGSE